MPRLLCPNSKSTSTLARTLTEAVSGGPGVILASLALPQQAPAVDTTTKRVVGSQLQPTYYVSKLFTGTSLSSPAAGTPPAGTPPAGNPPGGTPLGGVEVIDVIFDTVFSGNRFSKAPGFAYKQFYCS